MNTELNKKLIQLALNRSTPFCYGCYHKCPTGRCKECGSDDLMRLVHGVGCEYGTDWIIKHILETELDPVALEEQFEESIRQCTTIGMLGADGLAVFFGHRFTERISMSLVHRLASTLFILFGLGIALGF